MGPLGLSGDRQLPGSFYSRPPYDGLRTIDWSPVTEWLNLTSMAGSRDLSASASLCDVLVPAGAVNIALVGNGPLSAEDHRHAATFYTQTLNPTSLPVVKWVVNGFST